MYSKWNGAYKGRGDKAEKYPYEGILERDTNEFNRYISPESKFYSSLPTSTDGRSAATNSRNGLSGYGLASNKVQKEPIISLELSAGITPRTVNKKSPDTSPAAPTVILPAFSPKLITPPVAPSQPVAPVLTPPTLAVNVRSDGNGTGNVIIGNGSNSRIQSVA
ncbi:autotransporter-associated N-terminal domain-containing protein, partial [Fusobacterium polymorphum]